MSIFGDSGAPRWLEPTERHAILTQEGNSLSAGFMSSFARNDDPMLPLRQEQAKFNILNSAAQAEDSFQTLAANNTERAAWMKASPSVTPWLIATPEARESMPTPDPQGSQNALRAIEQTRLKDEQYFARKDANDIRRANSQIVRDRAKSLNTWNEALGAAPPDVVSAIDALPNQGYNLDANGNRLSPSREALSAFNTWSTANGTHPEKAFGYKPNAIETANARVTGAQALEGSKQTNREKLEDKKQDNRKELADIKQTQWLKREEKRLADRVNLEKLKASIRQFKTEAAFVDKHLDSIRKEILENNRSDFEIEDGPDKGKVDENKLLEASRTVLHAFWLKGGGSEQPKPSAPDWLNASTQAPSGAADKPEPAANSDPLGLLK